MPAAGDVDRELAHPEIGGPPASSRCRVSPTIIESANAVRPVNRRIANTIAGTYLRIEREPRGKSVQVACRVATARQSAVHRRQTAAKGRFLATIVRPRRALSGDHGVPFPRREQLPTVSGGGAHQRPPPSTTPKPRSKRSPMRRLVDFRRGTRPARLRAASVRCPLDRRRIEIFPTPARPRDSRR